MEDTQQTVRVRLCQTFGDRVRERVALAALTTFRTGGPADWMLETGEPNDLVAAVRATRASKFRSTISLTVHPAPRMTSDPMTNKTSNFPSGHEGDAREMLHQQGSNNSQVPMGRSARAKRR